MGGQHYPDACLVSWMLQSEDDKDSVMFAGYLSAPLRPGIFPIVPPPTPGTLDQLGILVSPSCDRADCSGGLYRSPQFQGESEILEVTRTHVAGRFDAVGIRSFAGDGVSGFFSVSLGDRNGLSDTHPCAPG